MIRQGYNMGKIVFQRRQYLVNRISELLVKLTLKREWLSAKAAIRIKETTIHIYFFTKFIRKRLVPEPLFDKIAGF